MVALNVDNKAASYPHICVTVFLSSGRAGHGKSSMSPSPGDETQPSELLSSGGVAEVSVGFGASKAARSLLVGPTAPGRQGSAAAIDPPPPSSDPTDLPSLRRVIRGLGHAEILEKLRCGSLDERAVAAEALGDAIKDSPMNSVLEVWEAGKDLIDTSNPSHTRVAGWRLLTTCTRSAASTDLERREFFQTISASANPEDFDLQLVTLQSLTANGRNLDGFSYDIFPLVTTWLHTAFAAVRSARRQVSHMSRGTSRFGKGKLVPSREDQSFSQLFVFVKDLLKFNCKFGSDPVIGDLVSAVLGICVKTNLEKDLRACIDLLETLVTFGAIPNDMLRDCVHVLGFIHSLVPKLQEAAWHTMGNILKSHHSQSTVRILLETLRTHTLSTVDDTDKMRQVRGSLSLLKKLLTKSAEKCYPTVPLTLLIEGLVNISKSRSSKVASEVLGLLNALFGDEDGKPIPLIADERWDLILGVAAEFAIDATQQDSENENKTAFQLKLLIARMEGVLMQNDLDILQRDECISFFAKVHHILPDTAVSLVIRHLRESRSCFPSELSWKKNMKLVLESFFMDQKRSASTRLQALETVVEVLSFLRLVEDLVPPSEVCGIIRRLLPSLAEENDTAVLKKTVAFLVKEADDADTPLFEQIIDAMKSVFTSERVRSPVSDPTLPFSDTSEPLDRPYFHQSLSQIVARGYVQIFIRSMDRDAFKATRTFAAIVHIARSSSCEVDARLTAMKLLFRLRADFDFRVYLVDSPGTDSLAASLYRTEVSLAKKMAEDAAQPPRRSEQNILGRNSRGVSFSQGQHGLREPPGRLTSPAKPVMAKTPHVWCLPDAEALPDIAPMTSSRVLFSFLEDESESCVKDEQGEKAEVAKSCAKRKEKVLDMASWLDVLLSLLHQGCDWELYSFILVHLPAQLANQPIFKRCVGQIQELRRTLCEITRTSSYHEPPSASGLRRYDVANCLFHSLAMLLSYHDYFQKVDEDDLVRSFMHGLTDKTAKTCIHALSVCCHETPLSVSKSLVSILQKMSQVITQPFVAMHILEFLAGLGRMPLLFGNFREEEFRIVFGICFRYLQYVRDKKRTAPRLAYVSESATPILATANNSSHHADASLAQQSTTDDLPQYVYALAYHVVTFWFLALKIHDRPTHIGWIAKNLFTDVDGSPINEERAQITLDFMQRVAYSEINDSLPDPLFNEDNYGEILERRWVVGSSIVSIKQAKESGWAEITRRTPSGVSSFKIQEVTAPTPSHQAATHTTIYPPHLLMQLVAPLPQPFDSPNRPIPLPGDDAGERAIKLFDRIPPVDGHKVGVIYISEGQTNEVEILANTQGSADYVAFLRGLGHLTRLKGATFNTQGLDREFDTDGMYTYCWRDRVTELVFHVTTQMPTDLDRDAQCIMKKRHTGNDFVNIIFNDSGLPFHFDTFPSEFNYVNIVITPTPRSSFLSVREADHKQGLFFMVRVMSKPGFPEISPAAEPKLIGLKALPSFVRLLAFNASVFCHVWANRAGGEWVSSWRARLREVNRLRERYGPKIPPGPLPPSTSNGSGNTEVAGGGANASCAAVAHQQQPPSQGISASGSDLTLPQRPASSVRDSYNSLRRASVATFLTTASTEQTQRTSVLSNDLSAIDTNLAVVQVNTAEALMDSLDFSKWA